MLALINPDEKVYDNENNVLGSRVCYFYDEEFGVAEPLFFVSTDFSFADADPQFFFHDDASNVVVRIPDDKLSEQLSSGTNVAIVPEQMEVLLKKLLREKLLEYGIDTSSSNTANTSA